MKANSEWQNEHGRFKEGNPGGPGRGKGHHDGRPTEDWIRELQIRGDKALELYDQYLEHGTDKQKLLVAKHIVEKLTPHRIEQYTGAKMIELFLNIGSKPINLPQGEVQLPKMLKAIESEEVEDEKTG